MGYNQRWLLGLRTARWRGKHLEPFLHLTIRPLGTLIAAELSRVLEVSVKLTFDQLSAADIQSRARAWRSLVGREAKMDEAMASRIVGFTEGD